MSLKGLFLKEMLPWKKSELTWFGRLKKVLTLIFVCRETNDSVWILHNGGYKFSEFSSSVILIYMENKSLTNKPDVFYYYLWRRILLSGNMLPDLLWLSSP